MLNRTRVSFSSFLSGVLILCMTVSASANNDFFLVRMKTTGVENAQDYNVIILSRTKSNGSGFTKFVTGWLEADTSATYGQGFMQVGLFANGEGLTWFTFSDHSVTCLHGRPAWGNQGCYGEYDDPMVVEDGWTRVELVTYGQGYWIARVWDGNDNVRHDVAKIWNSTTQIAEATVTAEQSYGTSANPYLDMDFYFYHPEYMEWGSGWQQWPVGTSGVPNTYSTLTNNPSISTSDICPPYVYNKKYNDVRAWAVADVTYGSCYRYTVW